MTSRLQILHWLAALTALAEALNKLERTAPCAPGLTPHERLVDSLKALAWCLLALGAGGGLIAPALLHLGASGLTTTASSCASSAPRWPRPP